MNGPPKPAYVVSEPHLSGYRVIIGYETLSDAQAAQAALSKPQAREDAQPDTDCVSLLADLDAGKPVGREAAATIRSLIAEHPAPDALRVALSDAMVEAACSRFVSESDDIWSASVWPEGPDDDGDRGDGGRVRLISEADQHNIRSAMRFAMTDALAALQAEQKGGA